MDIVHRSLSQPSLPGGSHGFLLLLVRLAALGASSGTACPRRLRHPSALTVSGWSKQVTPQTGVSFVCIADENIQMLVPPGSGTDDWAVDRSDYDEGLWLWACWEDRLGQVLVEFDAPTHHRQMRTAWALDELGQPWRDEVVELMRSQFEQLWALSTAPAGAPLEDGRTQGHAGILMALTVECQEAFPGERFWHARSPQRNDLDCLAVLGAPTLQAVSHARCADGMLPTRGIVVFAVRVLFRRLRGRPLQFSQLDEQVGSWIPATQAVDVSPQQPDRRRSDAAVSS